MRNPPLGLYIHVPWCVQKCPYCDFNSHTLKSGLPEHEYVSHLLDDLSIDGALVEGRPVTSIFIGGGTPSLLSSEAIDRMLSGVKERVALDENCEITLEANPGTVELERFKGYTQAGVNRISIGIQSFQTQHLSALGRIHDSQQALAAADYARSAGLSTFNLDLMHGLPQQTLENAMSDLEVAIAQAPPHLSWYQLTLEPNTPFYSKPPTLPDDDILWDIQHEGHKRLTEAGYQQYEISAYAKPQQQCQHNLNYWRFGDYLGIGCGAHSKITFANDNRIERRVKVKHPRGYMQLNRDYTDQLHLVEAADRPFEYFMNRFRLCEPCPIEEYHANTGLPVDDALQSIFNKAEDLALIQQSQGSISVTDHGRRYLNSLLEMFV
ncbi:radical SAM family heme chaperone HemW [Alteromonas facilis]|uniref:radical SAM family heme chaperone HemW n=1 Tax=Alteromonas facilis TaxID=2048004 RepID=UPI000C28440F|nr:radical SAM family heme chaperone HemW [Alteromonas facilis]